MTEENKAEKLAEKVESKIKYSFTVSYYGTEENKQAVLDFQNFAKKETDGGYLLAIRKLIDAYKADWKYASLYSELVELRELVAALQEPGVEEKSRVVKTFGGAKNE